ncbi:LADA_0H03290g1_1 [Lachancea dasiensis]|uniref:LADA_0H03290g1_1 n=1 Tax=Lachancea dasiensis TaxID=1072105 RepID=A0A1G4K0C8_9SACH|nr:LADA_0H03290g1_1 [Lachancea dasiensis]
MSSSAIPNVLVLSIDEYTEKLQPKRVRVSRACDVCRSKKIRCDGRQPCLHCTVYSHNCTYNPVSRSSKKMRTMSNTSKPDYLDQITSGHGSSTRAQPLNIRSNNSQLEMHYLRIIQALFPNLNTKTIDGAQCDKIVELIGKNKFQGLLNVEAVEADFLTMPAVPHNPNADINRGLEEISDSSSSPPNPLALQPLQIKIVLPPLDMARTLIFKSWKCACVLFRFNHRPSLLNTLEKLYETNPEEYTNDQNKALPLIYSILAVGALFTKDDFGKDKEIQNFFHQEGYKYFTAASKLIDTTNVADVSAIQTIFMMTIFLQCSAKLTTCYSLVGIALRAALRIGLHKKSSLVGCSPVEAEVKKRLFWTIYKIDVYVNIIMGLPVTLEESDIDQELPGNFNDEDITESGIQSCLSGVQISSCALSNEHTKLIRITKRIYDEVRSHKKKDSPSPLPHLRTVQMLQAELDEWQMYLPPQLKPHYNFVKDEEIKPYRLANYFLNFDYLHATLMLYRPFLNSVVSPPELMIQRPEELTMAMKCIATAREVVSLASEMCYQKILCGSYWFSVHVIFLGVTCIMFTVHQVRYIGRSALSDTLMHSLEKDLKKGIDLLLELKTCSVTSERTYNVLTKLFERFNDRSMESSAGRLQNLSISTKLKMEQAQEQSLQSSMVPPFEEPFLPSTTPSTFLKQPLPSSLIPSAFTDQTLQVPVGDDSHRSSLAAFFEDSYLSGMFDDWDTLLGSS